MMRKNRDGQRSDPAAILSPLPTDYLFFTILDLSELNMPVSWKKRSWPVQSAFPLAFIFPLALIVAGCFNYSTTQQTVNPPVILGISNEGGSHLIKVAAQNIEIGFAGYRLYQGDTEEDARDLEIASSYDCGLLATFPTQPIEYYIEVNASKTDPDSDDSNYLCVVTYVLTPGKWVSLRSLIARDLTTKDASISSNAVMVP